MKLNQTQKLLMGVIAGMMVLVLVLSLFLRFLLCLGLSCCLFLFG